jgi:hypothetical protein
MFILFPCYQLKSDQYPLAGKKRKKKRPAQMLISKAVERNGKILEHTSCVISSSSFEMRKRGTGGSAYRAVKLCLGCTTLHCNSNALQRTSQNNIRN